MLGEIFELRDESIILSGGVHILGDAFDNRGSIAQRLTQGRCVMTNATVCKRWTFDGLATPDTSVKVTCKTAWECPKSVTVFKVGGAAFGAGSEN
ncbi:MAG: hypothetical protein AAGF32_00720 [Pseudomonadota bacterium]